MQHGVIYDNYRSLYELQDFGGLNEQSWPDVLAVWDDSSALRASREAAGRSKVARLGHPWLDFVFRNRAMWNRQEDEWSRLKVRAANPVLLVTLQWGLGDRTGMNHLGMASALADTIVHRQDIVWIIQPHPVQLRDVRHQVYGQLESFSSELNHVRLNVGPTALPLPLALLHSWGHVTTLSSVTIEAELLGRRTACFLPESWERTCPGILDRPSVSNLTKEAELVDWVGGLREPKEEATQHRFSYGDLFRLST